MDVLLQIYISVGFLQVVIFLCLRYSMSNTIFFIRTLEGKRNHHETKNNRYLPNNIPGITFMQFTVHPSLLYHTESFITNEVAIAIKSKHEISKNIYKFHSIYRHHTEPSFALFHSFASHLPRWQPQTILIHYKLVKHIIPFP